jgi:hypothetical protein
MIRNKNIYFYFGVLLLINIVFGDAIDDSITFTTTMITGTDSTNNSTNNSTSNRFIPINRAAYGCNNPSFPNACLTGNTVQCVNFASDNNHCGSCTNVCGSGVSCSTGSCGSCPSSSQIYCLGACITPSSSNCGSCGTTCTSTQACTGTGAAATCTSLGYTTTGCTTDDSTGTGETVADQPITVLVSGTQSILPQQCSEYCTQISTSTPLYFTLYTDTFGSGQPGSSSSINTVCSCYYGTTQPFDVTTTGTCTSNGYGTTSNGVGSWEAYSIP